MKKFNSTIIFVSLFSVVFLLCSCASESMAQIYADGDDAEWKTNPTSFKYEERIVTANDILHLKLTTSGGCAIRIIKIKKS